MRTGSGTVRPATTEELQAHNATMGREMRAREAVRVAALTWRRRAALRLLTVWHWLGDVRARRCRGATRSAFGGRLVVYDIIPRERE